MEKFGFYSVVEIRILSEKGMYVMKKVLVLLLVFVMAVSIIGCGKKEMVEQKNMNNIVIGLADVKCDKETLKGVLEDVVLDSYGTLVSIYVMHETPYIIYQRMFIGGDYQSAVDSICDRIVEEKSTTKPDLYSFLNTLSESNEISINDNTGKNNVVIVASLQNVTGFINSEKALTDKTMHKESALKNISKLQINKLTWITDSPKEQEPLQEFFADILVRSGVNTLEYKTVG